MNMDMRSDYGCFFLKAKKNREVGFVIYVKTNYLLKHHPEMKLNYFDEKTKKVSSKPHARNKIWYIAFSGKSGRGGECLDDFTIAKFKDLFMEYSEEIYNYRDYPSSSDLYAAMNDSKTGIPKVFTKKWFEDEYKFIENQFASIV
jgi:hypothetical protein